MAVLVDIIIVFLRILDLLWKMRHFPLILNLYRGYQLFIMIIALLSILYRKILHPLILKRISLRPALILAMLLAICYACRNAFLHSIHFNKIKIMKNSPSHTRKDDQEEETYDFP